MGNQLVNFFVIEMRNDHPRILRMNTNFLVWVVGLRF